MCIEVNESEWEELGPFCGRCADWTAAKCGGRWVASVWRGKPGPAAVPMVLLERMHRSHRAEDSMIVRRADLSRARDPELRYRPQQWVKTCRLERWMEVPWSATLRRRDEIELDCQRDFVNMGLCGQETAAKWKAERRRDKKPALNEMMSGRNVRRSVGPLSRYEAELRNRLDMSLQGADSALQPMGERMAHAFLEEKKKSAPKAVNFDAVPLNWHNVPKRARREHLTEGGVPTGVPVLSVVPVTFMGSVDRESYAQAVRLRVRTQEPPPENTSIVQLHVWAGDHPARDQHLYLKLKPECGGTFYAAREVPWEYQETYWSYLWAVYNYSGEGRYGRCCSSCLLADVRCGDCEPCRTGGWCQHRQCITASWRRRSAPWRLLSAHGLRCPPAFRVGANVRDTDAVRRRVRRSRQLGLESSVRLRELAKVEEMVVDVSPADVTVEEFSPGAPGVGVAREGADPAAPAGGPTEDSPLVPVGGETPGVALGPGARRAPSPSPLVPAGGRAPEAALESEERRAPSPSLPGRPVAGGSADIAVVPLSGPVEPLPLLPSASRPPADATVTVMSAVAVMVGASEDLASLRGCVGLCSPDPGVTPGLCADSVRAHRLLLAFRCPELYCPGPATPGGVRGFRGYACVSVGQVARHLVAHGYAPEEVTRHVVEVLGHEVRRRRESMLCPALSRRVRCAYPFCPVVGSVGEMWRHADEHHRFDGAGLEDPFYGRHGGVPPRERVAARLVMEELAGLEVGRSLKSVKLPVGEGGYPEDGLIEVCLGMRPADVPVEGVEVMVGWAEPSFVKI